MTQRREFFQAAGTRAVYTTSLAPRNSAKCSIFSPIFDATSLSSGAPGSACTELIFSVSLLFSKIGSILPINLSPPEDGEYVVTELSFLFRREHFMVVVEAEDSVCSLSAADQIVE